MAATTAVVRLVVILRAHVDEFGAAEDGRLFRSQRGNHLAPVSYESVWRRAREHVLTAAQFATPLAQRPYDLRHACLSLWLNGGVPAANVAARAGDSVAMLQSTYAHCIDGDDEIMNRRIDTALGAPPTLVAERAEQTAPPLPHPRARVPRSFREYRRTTTHSGSPRHTREGPAQASDPGGGGAEQVDEPSPNEDARCLHSAG